MGDTLTSNSSANRKRTLISLIVAFLLIGGGIFTFLIFQGLGDLKGDGAGNFTYGFAARNIVLPLSNYFSLGDDLGVARRTGAKLTVKGAEPSLLDGTSADVSDWMAKGDSGTNTGAGSGTGAGRASASSSSPGGKTVVPKMGGGLGSAVGGGSSGGSKSSGSPSKFSGGASASNTSVTEGKDGKGFGQSKSGTLNALSQARVSLSDGLKSGSAMTAKAKWDQGFGLGSTGKKTGDMAYGKSSLVGLDHIKKGDIADLKLTDSKSLKTSEPTPERDTASEAKDSNLAKMAGKEGADAANKAMTEAVGQAGKNAGKDGGKLDMPDQATIDLATKPPPDGIACGTGTQCSQERGYGDDKLTYSKNAAGNWEATYDGTQGDVKYRDKVELLPGQDPNYKVTGSSIQGADGNWLATCEPGGTAVAPCGQ